MKVTSLLSFVASSISLKLTDEAVGERLIIERGKYDQRIPTLRDDKRNLAKDFRRVFRGSRIKP